MCCSESQQGSGFRGCSTNAFPARTDLCRTPLAIRPRDDGSAALERIEPQRDLATSRSRSAAPPVPGRVLVRSWRALERGAGDGGRPRGGPGAVLAHLSVAALFRTSRFPAPVPHVLVPRRHRPIDGIILHSYRRLDPLDVTVYRGIPVTTVARMLVDLERRAHEVPARERDLRGRVSGNASTSARRGERCDAQTGAATSTSSTRPSTCTSAAARGRGAHWRTRFLHLLQSASVPEPLVNMHLTARRSIATGPIACWSSKSTVRATAIAAATEQRRCAQGRQAQSAGYTVLRFTDVEIERRPEDVLARLLRCL